MVPESSELVSKDRLFKRAPAASIRPSGNASKAVILGARGFEYNGKRNADIQIKCNKNESIKIIHQDNGGTCHLGLPRFDGKIYVMVHTSVPSSGSINYGFSDTVLFVDGKESPNLLIAEDMELIFVCLNHDIGISVKSINGIEYELSESPSPSFAPFSRCWSFLPYGLKKGDVIKYGISGKNNSGGAVLIVSASDTNSLPWWNLHSAFAGDSGWRIRISDNLIFDVINRSDANRRPSSFSGKVISVNGVEQPRLLAACGDSFHARGFVDNVSIGNCVIYQDGSHSVSLDSESSIVSVPCGVALHDPYDPYDTNEYSFDGRFLSYYGSGDRASGEQLIVKEGGWDLHDLIYVSAYRSGYVENIKLSQAGSFVICCSEFGYSGLFFHVQVEDNDQEVFTIQDTSSVNNFMRLKSDGINAWVRSDASTSKVNRYVKVDIVSSMIDGMTGSVLQKSLYQSVASILKQQRMISGDILLVDFSYARPKIMDVSYIYNGISMACNEFSIKQVINFDSVDVNARSVFQRLDCKFYFDVSTHLYTSYPVDLLMNGFALIDSRSTDSMDIVKILMSLGVKNFIFNGKLDGTDAYIAAMSALLAPSFNDSLKYHCMRSKQFAENVGIVSTSSNISGLHVKDPVFDTQYGGIEIFRKIRDISREGFSTVFIMPNGEWDFPFAKYSNWHYPADILRSISDAFIKIKDDFDIIVGISIHVKSVQENERATISLCGDLGISKLLLIDAIYVDDAELINISKRFLDNYIEIYFEGHPRKVSSGLLSSSFCYGKWLWWSRHRGPMPVYLKDLVREI